MSFVGGPPGYTASWAETTIVRGDQTFSFKAQITIGQETYNFEVLIRREKDEQLLSVKHDFPGPSVENLALSAAQNGGLTGKGTVQWQNREAPLNAAIQKNDKGEVEFSFGFNGATAKTDLNELREKPLYSFTFIKRAG